MALTPIRRPARRGGEWVNPGLYEYKPYDDGFIGGALPSWLTVPAVTGQNTEGAVTSYGNFPGAKSFLKVQCAARANAQAKLASAISFDTTVTEGCLWELDGLRFDSDAGIVAMGLAGSGGKGMFLQQTQTEDTAVLRWGAGAGVLPTKFKFRGGGYAFSVRNVRMYARFRDASVFVFINDQCVAHVENAASFGQGTITPDVSITTTASAAQMSLSVARARLRIFGA